MWAVLFLVTVFLSISLPTVTAFWLMTPNATPDGHTCCGKCGYILKGLTEPRCPECGERI